MIKVAVLALTGSPVLLLLFVLSAYGWWRLLARDSITDGLRDWFYHKWPHEGFSSPIRAKRGRTVYSGSIWYTETGTFWGELLYCPYCSGWWIALIQFLLFAFWSPLVVTIPGILHGTRIVMGFLSQRV